MWRLAVRSVTAHRARLAMTLATVAVGTGFVAGTLAFSAAPEQAERSISQRGDVAVQVRPADAQGHLPRSTVDDLAGLSGVARADAVVSGPARCWAGTARWSRTPVG
jgi:putative ABC transport system permease protein